jgi:hypothetical protein
MTIGQVITGSASRSQEARALDWQPQSQSSQVFGDVTTKSRRAQVDNIEEEFLKKNWSEDTIRDGVIETHVESDSAKSGTTWVARQVIIALYPLESLMLSTNHRPGVLRSSTEKEDTPVIFI